VARASAIVWIGAGTGGGVGGVPGGGDTVGGDTVDGVKFRPAISIKPASRRAAHSACSPGGPNVVGSAALGSASRYLEQVTQAD
jgi:hypothetical protein